MSTSTSTFTLKHVADKFSNLSIATVLAYIKYNIPKGVFKKVGYGKYEGNFTDVVLHFAQTPRYGYLGDDYVKEVVAAPNTSPKVDTFDFHALAAENSRLAKENVVLREFHTTFENTIRSVAQELEPPPLRLIPTPDKKSHKFAVICNFGDWHDPDPAMLDTYIKIATKIICSNLNGEIDEIVLSFGGDDQNGTNIYPKQAYYVTRDNTEQCERVGYLKVKLCHWARQLCAKVRALQADGNHARGGFGKGGDAHPHDNWDRMSGKFAESHTKRFVDWEYIPFGSMFLETKVAGMTVVTTHGQHIKAQLKTPHYGIDRWALVARDYVREEWRRDPQILLLHHHHRLFGDYVGKTFVAMPGSLQPHSMYAKELGAPESYPAQSLITIKADDNPLIWGWHPILCGG